MELDILQQEDVERFAKKVDAEKFAQEKFQENTNTIIMLNIIIIIIMLNIITKDVIKGKEEENVEQDGQEDSVIIDAIKEKKEENAEQDGV